MYRVVFSALLLAAFAGNASAQSKPTILEASHGLNCRSHPGNKVKVGNATEALRAICAKQGATCSYRIDSKEIGDPAPGCAKEFFVRWQCGDKQDSNTLGYPAEGSTAVIACQ